jgi:hypothetical protein
MPRRADPARIYEARRAGAVARLTSQTGPEWAEQPVAAWEAEAELRRIPRGDQRYCYDGERWLEERIR